MDFSKVLIANRGEIALRAIYAANMLDLKTVAIFSKGEENDRHVKLADDSFYLGDGNLAKTYLNIPKILQACQENGADAVYPGYGFLSENPNFAEQVSKKGYKFIGPSATAIANLGHKLMARKKAQEANLKIIPGSTTLIKNFSHAKDIAEQIGYPVILKANYGGGGVGILNVESPSKMEEAYCHVTELLDSVQSSSEIYIEKYLDHPKHIEIQFFADKYGNIVHLGERECSIQRRHQKLLEESPSPALNEKMREELGTLVVEFIRTYNYENAGTVEFLYHDGEFYFIEVNTRMQNEIGVTELVTNYDLILEQFHVALGQTLSFSQDDIKLRGHAIEVRINTENPLDNFHPSPGTINSVILPSSAGIRTDTAIYEGYHVSSTFDPLIAKILAWDVNREQCRKRLLTALSDFKVEGVMTNKHFHEVLLNSPEFITGKYDTKTIKNSNIIDILQKEQHHKVIALLAHSMKSNYDNNPYPLRIDVDMKNRRRI